MGCLQAKQAECLVLEEGLQQEVLATLCQLGMLRTSPQLDQLCRKIREQYVKKIFWAGGDGKNSYFSY
jgi:hypothetical protein